MAGIHLDRTRTIVYIASLILVLLVLALLGGLKGCSYFGVGGACGVPRVVAQGDILGEWTLDYGRTYPQYYVSDPLSGTVIYRNSEPYLLRTDGSVQPLDLYCRNKRPEEIWAKCPDLRGQPYPMRGQERITFFKDGTYQQRFASDDYSYVSQVERWELIESSSDGPKLRMHGMKYFAAGVAQAESPHGVELTVQLQDALRIREREDLTEDVNAAVIYPDDGFVYLYPRVCLGKLSLVQMAFGQLSTSDFPPTNPVFRRDGRQ